MLYIFFSLINCKSIQNHHMYTQQTNIEILIYNIYYHVSDLIHVYCTELK